MNKKEILHIVFIAFGIYFLMTFLFSLSALGFAMSMEENEYISKGSQIFWTSINCILLFILTYIFLVRNHFLIGLFASKITIEDSSNNEQELIIYRMSFWVKIIGLYYFISSSSNVLAQLPSILSSTGEGMADLFWWNQTGSHLIALVISISFILKSESIEKLIKKINKKDAQPSASPDAQKHARP